MKQSTGKLISKILTLITIILFLSIFSLLGWYSINNCDFKSYTYTGYVEEVKFLDYGCCGGDTVVYFREGNILIFNDYEPFIPTNRNITFYYNSLCDKDKFKLSTFKIND